MRALNTIGRPIVTDGPTIGGGAAGGPVDLGALFPVGQGDVSVDSSGRVAGAAYDVSILAKSHKTVQLSDGTSIAFSSVRPQEHELA